MTSFRFQSPRGATVVVRRDEYLFSVALGRVVRLDVVLPPGFSSRAAQPYPVLYLHDGQDLARLRLPATLNRLFRQGEVRPFVLVAIHAADRLQEYGVAARPDYLGRGSRAGRYTDFMLKELLPYVQAHYHASAEPAEAAVAGMSLGGLMAFDLAWHHPEAFLKCGAFSGSFWWRGRGLADGYTDADRLMHQLVTAGRARPGQQFWLQTGTDDETSDRNNNGIIDAIDDTLDLLATLAAQGLPAASARYVEVPGGHHHPDTWGTIMPDFLHWAFGTKELAAAEVAARTPRPARWRLGGRALLRRPGGAARWKFQYLRRAATFAAMPASAAITLARPAPGTYLPYTQAYIDLVPAAADPLTQLRQQAAEMHRELAGLTEAQALLRYAPGKWTPKEVLVHLTDAERIFAYRALRFARADAQELPGFDENDFAANSEANDRLLSDLLTEYHAVRAATLAFFGGLNGGQLDRAGRANGGATSVRALLYIIAGHEQHHLRILRERYWPLLPAAQAG
ncbi:alpha/beta hydrolase-fold protein [Hymenobacter cheonanensis]|uniref:alpha/beta hydrolase-fold protein n=1 Tax=Hymenobacter sp. CA2-7 TaxID=3063993 RepID=UPI002713C3F6|nr:alpha/beta hydrolase-fold protein [Hymenobacter sp. CA2-7]MDO7887317.1 alpha/beta hydrolase-fold protein [Hymenobacter sp. CA2-7]